MTAQSEQPTALAGTVSVSSADAVDVVIPVHDAPSLTRRCIEAVFRHLRGSIRHVLVQDDASGPETREMLVSLARAGLQVHHAPENVGFAHSVNAAVARSDAPLVLVLNSDTEAGNDFVPVLRGALAADSRLAALNPAGNMFARYDFARYVRQPGGYVRAHKLLGFAFLIRRAAFDEAGGFDPVFGRGYSEDTDLSRRLTRRGWRLGVHPEARLFHASHGSFGRSPAVKALIWRNRLAYHARYPAARRNVLLLGGRRPLGDLSDELREALDEVAIEGGAVHWVTPQPASLLPWLEMSSHPAGLRSIATLMRRGRRRFYKRLTEVWIEPDADPWHRGRRRFYKRLTEVWIEPDADRWLARGVRFWAKRRGLVVVERGLSAPAAAGRS
jgi:GT2 family glycosyltransferase